VDELRLVHRDVRQSKIVCINNGEDEVDEVVPMLIDWASTRLLGEKMSEYSGTDHYASVNVLKQLSQEFYPTPAPAA